MLGSSSGSRHRDKEGRIPANLRPLVRDLQLVAAGDLTVTIDGGSSPAGQAIAATVGQIVDNLRELLTDLSTSRAGLGAGWREVNDVAWGMLQMSETTVDHASSAATTANDVSDSMQRIAAATEELAATIREVANHASLASSVASRGLRPGRRRQRHRQRPEVVLARDRDRRRPDQLDRQPDPPARPQRHHRGGKGRRRRSRVHRGRW